ncbi:MAG: hypothetical protein LBK47_05050 [Prevotellaceae bacterium]|jgi:hypothetical protein|nr:hypothetical protein [Prevotellaceae bacterium]
MKHFFLSMLLLSFASLTVAEESDSLAYDIKPPVFDGKLKIKMEHDFKNGYSRMEVRNARLGLKGRVLSQVFYRMQVDLSNAGRFMPLDFYAGYEVGNFSFIAGQQSFGFSTELDKNPVEIYFSNISLLSQYITTYPMNSRREIGAIGSRDIGAMLSYSLKDFAPVTLSAGVFNGESINTSAWGNDLNYALRIDAGMKTGARGAISYYGGHTPVGDDLRMVNAEFRYIAKNFGVECEYAQRYVTDSITEKLSAAFIQGYYVHDFTPNKYVHYLKPTLRYDVGNNLGMATPFGIEFTDIQRVTVGLNVGVIRQKNILGELRFNAELYFVKDKPSTYDDDASLHNKLVVEVAVSF